jgi:hypothetical protein
MLVPQRQQSATISQRRIDIGDPHSGQAHAKTFPSSQTAAGFLPVEGAGESGSERQAATSQLESEWLSLVDMCPSSSRTGAREPSREETAADPT